MSKLGYVKNLGNGKYLLRLSLGFDEFGKRRQPSKTISAKSDMDAERQLARFYADELKKSQNHIVEAPKTLSALKDDWMEHHVKANLRHSTEVFYENLWEKHLKDFGKAKIKNFTPKMINEIIAKLPSGGKARRATYGMLKSMFNKAKQWEYITDNPCDHIDTPKYHAKEKEIYTEDEIKNVLKIIQSEPLIYQAIFYFAVLCAMRRGEIVGLKWEDINFEAQYFDIKRSAAAVTGSGTVTGETKNYTSKRRLELPEMIVPILNGIKVEQTKQRLLLGNKWNDEGWVFARWNGKILSATMPNHWMSRMRQEHPEFPHKDLHTLRHTALSFMIQSGVPISIVSKAAGHAQQSTTLNIYSHIIQSTKAQAIKAQEEIISEIKKSVQ